MTFDQLLYALAKDIQWNWPESFGEKQFVVMMGGLHIEMAALKALGTFLKGSSWIEALTVTSITTPGTTESFLNAGHVKRCRHAHKVTYIFHSSEHVKLTSLSVEKIFLLTSGARKSHP